MGLLDDIKPKPNHRIYLQTLKNMTPAQRLQKTFELSAMSKALFLQGIKKRFPEYSESQIKVLYLKRIALCYNRNY